MEGFPEAAFALEVEIEGFVIGAVAEVMPNVALSEEVEGGGEKECEAARKLLLAGGS